MGEDATEPLHPYTQAFLQALPQKEWSYQVLPYPWDNLPVALALAVIAVLIVAP